MCGFFFRGEPTYTPDDELDNFLRSGPPPVYIGFGSIVMDDAENMTAILLGAVRACGVRAIISRGWSKLGTGQQDPNILFLGDCPHGILCWFPNSRVLSLTCLKNGFSSTYHVLCITVGLVLQRVVFSMGDRRLLSPSLASKYSLLKARDHGFLGTSSVTKRVTNGKMCFREL